MGCISLFRDFSEKTIWKNQFGWIRHELSRTISCGSASGGQSFEQTQITNCMYMCFVISGKRKEIEHRGVSRETRLEKWMRLLEFLICSMGGESSYASSRSQSKILVYLLPHKAKNPLERHKVIYYQIVYQSYLATGGYLLVVSPKWNRQYKIHAFGGGRGGGNSLFN